MKYKLFVFDLDETDTVCRYITQGGDPKAFLKQFEGAISDGFDPKTHLKKIVKLCFSSSVQTKKN